MSDTRLYYYWGKAKPEDGEGPAYHLLPHCLDVANL